MSHILIIDDDSALCRSLAIQLGARDHDVSIAATAGEGLELVRQRHADLLLLDLGLPDADGLDTLTEIRRLSPEIPVAVITGRQDTAATIEAVRAGAFDYLRKPFELDDIVLLIEKARRLRANAGPIRAMGPEEQQLGRYEIVGADRAVIDLVKQVALLSRTRVTVLITGESGTGKELVARALHEAGSAGRPFVAVNCSAVVPSLFESELFGHEKGSFTGADESRIGKLDQAADGSIFFDEIADTPLDLQAKLLRVLQEHEFERVGGRERIPFGARVLAATNRDIDTMLREGTLRSDLYYRLAVSPLRVPPLRDRRGDIPRLAEHLIRRLSVELHRRVDGIEEDAIDMLQAYDWPGNVRELENALTRAIALSSRPILRREDFGFLAPATPAAAPAPQVIPLREAEKHHVA
ncbi:MAG: sigma-54-dependent Fis family transcriptional regulator, partial [Planctomycetes bacterium]|nr:sigma-54-dependent Fis family transcriptional regulator [Planctomycetota bacterium]